MIQLLTQPAPTLDPRVTGYLDLMFPRTFMVWNPHYAYLGENRWDARWQIWVELADNSNPDLERKAERTKGLSKKDRWNADAHCWMRYLQTYNNRDGSFAPVDERLLIGLELADTWANRRFYEDNVEDPEAFAEDAKMRMNRSTLADSTSYYRKYDAPIVGAYVNSGWRGSRYGAL